MRLFETIKETVTVGQAAEYYGMKIGRNNMICCPFHNDHSDEYNDSSSAIEQEILHELHSCNNETKEQILKIVKALQ